jgi:Plasmid pRiA4b ORF-3-like protein
MARKRSEPLADQAIALAEYAAKAVIAAEHLGIKANAVEQFPLDVDERTTLALLPTLPAKIKKKLALKDSSFTVAEVASMVMAAAESFLDAEAKRQTALVVVAKKLMDGLQASIAMLDVPAKAKKASPADTVYQFKITLLDSQPTIWRRIQVMDCTLEKLHEHIQTAMGWTNSHLNQFKIGEQRYADPLLMEKDFEEVGYLDSTTTKVSKILPKTGKQFRFQYEYDFGDSWYHKVLLEGCPKAESGRQYPICLEGARACPAEDVGGVPGYAAFLEAIQNPDHNRHRELLEWVGGAFDPEAFDPVTATKSMKKGLPDWRKEEWI